MAAYVIKEWKLSNTPLDARNTFINIVGRAPGLLSWILSHLGIDPTVTFKLTGDKVLFEVGSLEGSIHRVIPLRSISSTMYGYTKPWKEAVAIGVLIGIPTFGIGIILAIVYYFLNRRLSIFVVEVSGIVSGFEFKRSVIEGQEINEMEAARVATMIQAFVDRAPGAPAQPQLAAAAGY